MKSNLRIDVFSISQFFLHHFLVQTQFTSHWRERTKEIEIVVEKMIGQRASWVSIWATITRRVVIILHQNEKLDIQKNWKENLKATLSLYSLVSRIFFVFFQWRPVWSFVLVVFASQRNKVITPNLIQIIKDIAITGLTW
jgi:hypothetical protein